MTNLRPILDRFRGRRIAVIGDLILDEFIWGRVDRISPEAPVPIVEVTRESERLGGAANVARNLVALGATVRLVGVIGDDEPGRRFLAHLDEDGIDRSLIVSDPTRRTTTKSRIIAHHQQVCRFDRENRSAIAPGATGGLQQRALEALQGVDAVILSDYAKGVVSRDLTRSISEEAGRRELFLAADPKVKDLSLYEGVTLITPNLKETALASGMEKVDSANLKTAVRRIQKKCQARYVLVTQGEQGMSLLDGNELIHFPAVAREVFDVTGAGDTVIAAFTLSVSAGATMREAASLANHAAGVVVGKLGTATLTVAELETALEASPPDGAKGNPTLTESET